VQAGAQLIAFVFTKVLNGIGSSGLKGHRTRSLEFNDSDLPT
jgi:hypothetical protein